MESGLQKCKDSRKDKFVTALFGNGITPIRRHRPSTKVNDGFVCHDETLFL